MTGTALITGGSKRIGAAITQHLAKMGYNLVITYNNSASEAKSLAKKIQNTHKVKCEIFHCDLFDSKQTKKLADFTKSFAAKSKQDWNLLINNASIFNKSDFLASSEDEALNNFNLHLLSPLTLSRAMAKNLSNKKTTNAQIINITDANITRSKTNYFYYLLSKKFLSELTKMLAVALAPKIRVNAIAPGLILENPSEDRSCDEWILAAKKIPLTNHKGSPQDITQAIEFLIKNPFITGQTLFIDGGQSCIN